MAASIAQFTGLRSAASFVGAKAEKGLPSVACKATGPKGACFKWSLALQVERGDAF